MTLPKTGGPEWAGGQASPEVQVNEALRRLDANVSRAIIVDRDLTAPPGSCADGANYLVAASPTGAWAGQAGKMATAIGENASNGWKFQTVAVEGFQLYVQDENLEIQYDGAAWVSASVTDEAIDDRVAALMQEGNGISLTYDDGTNALTIAVEDEVIDDRVATLLVEGGGISITYDDGSNTLTISVAPPAVTEQIGTSYTAALADANSVIEFNNASAITFTIPTNAAVAFPVGTVIEIHQKGAGQVTPTPDSGVTLQVRAGFSALAGQYSIAMIRKVATNTWRLTGDLT